MGDPSGIGGEIILKSLPYISKKSIPVIIGDFSAIDHLKKIDFQNRPFVFKRFREGYPGEAEFVDLGLLNKIDFGVVDGQYGNASYRYIIEALKLIFLGEVSAIVTCPINKASIHRAGVEFIGHTELLAHYSSISDYVMMMTNRAMRVSLVTTHIPLRAVPASISSDAVFKCISIADRSLRHLFAIPVPTIKVCGLNPHAGEKGIMGNEEEFIREAIERAKSLGIHADGPYPADTLFHNIDCDSYIAMYHDQGLIPVKTVGFDTTVNITLGLPFVRTSPGHGTGFDIAGKGIANPSSFLEAYRLAERLSVNPEQDKINTSLTGGSTLC
jgi:4-hydroxythreonine-4-phosphate dehydrogenase